MTKLNGACSMPHAIPIISGPRVASTAGGLYKFAHAIGHGIKSIASKSSNPRLNEFLKSITARKTASGSSEISGTTESERINGRKSNAFKTLARRLAPSLSHSAADAHLCECKKAYMALQKPLDRLLNKSLVPANLQELAGYRKDCEALLRKIKNVPSASGDKTLEKLSTGLVGQLNDRLKKIFDAEHAVVFELLSNIESGFDALNAPVRIARKNEDLPTLLETIREDENTLKKNPEDPMAGERLGAYLKQAYQRLKQIDRLVVQGRELLDAPVWTFIENKNANRIKEKIARAIDKAEQTRPDLENVLKPYRKPPLQNLSDIQKVYTSILEETRIHTGAAKSETSESIPLQKCDRSTSLFTEHFDLDSIEEMPEMIAPEVPDIEEETSSSGHLSQVNEALKPVNFNDESLVELMGRSHMISDLPRLAIFSDLLTDLLDTFPLHEEVRTSPELANLEKEVNKMRGKIENAARDLQDTELSGIESVFESLNAVDKDGTCIDRAKKCIGKVEGNHAWEISANEQLRKLELALEMVPILRDHSVWKFARGKSVETLKTAMDSLEADAKKWKGPLEFAIKFHRLTAHEQTGSDAATGKKDPFNYLRKFDDLRKTFAPDKEIASSPELASLVTELEKTRNEIEVAARGVMDAELSGIEDEIKSLNAAGKDGTCIDRAKKTIASLNADAAFDRQLVSEANKPLREMEAVLKTLPILLNRSVLLYAPGERVDELKRTMERLESDAKACKASLESAIQSQASSTCKLIRDRIDQVSNDFDNMETKEEKFAFPRKADVYLPELEDLRKDASALLKSHVWEGNLDKDATALQHELAQLLGRAESWKGKLAFFKEVHELIALDQRGHDCFDHAEEALNKLKTAPLGDKDVRDELEVLWKRMEKIHAEAPKLFANTAWKTIFGERAADMRNTLTSMKNNAKNWERKLSEAYKDYSSKTSLLDEIKREFKENHAHLSRFLENSGGTDVSTS